MKSGKVARDTLRPEPGQIVFACEHIFGKCTYWHFFSLRGYPPVEVQGEMITPEWITLCQECFMLPGEASEHVGAWFEWQESMAGGIEKRRVM